MHFYVYRPTARPKPKDVEYPAIFLFDDNWNDYGYTTLFRASFQASRNSDEVEIGELKILELPPPGADPLHSPRLQPHFERLSNQFCSLGQSIRYYRRLRDTLGKKMREGYLRAIRDIVASPSEKPKFIQAAGFKTSLLRNGGAEDALRRGGFYINRHYEEDEPPAFEFKMLLPGASADHNVTFDFKSVNALPNRMILLIGRNGTGKTQLLSHLAHRLYGEEGVNSEGLAVNGAAHIIGEVPIFSKIIAISYSAFDQFPIPAGVKRRGRKTQFDYKYCGLRNAAGAIDMSELKLMLDSAMLAIDKEDRADILNPLVERLLGVDQALEFATDTRHRDELFERLSAGQRFILAIIADIVGFIEMRSILLFDEPETHLHPGLMSTLIAILGEILNEFGSYAIVATHSPILLQQVPSRYVRVLRRTINRTTINRPNIETFGEDLAELTKHVFELSESEQDFHSVLDALVSEGRSVKEIKAMFERELPLPVQIYLESLTAGDI
jgi:predicted ATPase